MPSPDERQIFQIIGDKGGQTNIATVAARMGVRYEYCSIICNSIGSRGYVDVFIGGKIRLTPKGWATIGKSPADQFGDKTAGMPSTRETILRQLGAKGTPSQAGQVAEDTSTQGKSDENTVICPLCGSKIPKTVFLKGSSKADFSKQSKNPLNWFKDMTQEKPADLPSVQKTIMEQLENESPAEKPKKPSEKKSSK